VRLAAALHTACDTADAASQPGTRTSAGSSGMTTAATALPLPLYHNHVAYSANQWHHWKNTNHVLLTDATLTSYHAVRRYATPLPIAVDLRPRTDGSAVRTALVAHRGALAHST